MSGVEKGLSAKIVKSVVKWIGKDDDFEEGELYRSVVGYIYVSLFG